MCGDSGRSVRRIEPSLFRDRGHNMFRQLLSLVTLGSVCIAAIATYITVRHNSQQLGAQIFLAYSGRVREIRQAAALETRDIEVTLSAIFLIFELYELRRRGYVSNAIWSIWDRDIADLLREDDFRAQWDTLRVRLRNHVHFIKWVDDQLEDIRSSTGP
jgi:hypothetical protein